MNSKIVNIGLAIALSALCLTAVAGKDDVPNGKPFQNIQEQVDATKSALDAANEARTAAIIALEAADSALRAKDEVLQGQINEIKLTIAEEVARINSEINGLEQKISEVEAGSDEADALQDIIIDRLSDAINLLRNRAGAAEEASKLQNAQIDLLWARAQAIEMKSDAQYVEARAKFINVEQSIINALAAADLAYSLGGQAMARANQAYALAVSDVDYNALLSQLNTVKAIVNKLDNHLSAVCPIGFYVIGVNSDGALKCRTITDTVSITQALTAKSYCTEDTFFGCLDYAYYQIGTAFCPIGYLRTATNRFMPNGVDHISYTEYLEEGAGHATYQTNTFDSPFTNTGSVTVSCARRYFDRTVYGNN